MATPEDTITIAGPAKQIGRPLHGFEDTFVSEPSPGEIDGEQLPNVAARLDKFSILRKLGSGGMGEVYVGYDEHLGRKVAIKLMRRQLASQTSRFVREAQGLARLSHPNVVQVYEFGTFEGRLFLAMEFVAGGTLRDWLRAERRTTAEIIAVFCEAGRGLAAAHAANLVHRDFKPDNVMVGDDGRVRVMDFGLVHERGETDALTETSDHDDAVIADRRRSSALNLELTQPGALLGTPAYMAPEQHLSRPTDARTDQFSFCVALWEALYGHRPFAGETLLELVDSVVEHRVVEPSRGADVPSWLRAVVERGLSQYPEERWPSMDDLLAALSNDPTRRRRRVIASGVAAGLVAAALVGNYVRLDRQREAARAEAAAIELDRDRRCTAEGERIREVWDLDDAERLATTFRAVGHPLAEDSLPHARELLDGYASEWSSARKQVCVATETGEAIDADLARICLDERRTMFAQLVDSLAEVDELAEVLDVVQAAARLPGIGECRDPQQLARSIRLPGDPALREQVVAARRRVARIQALRTFGKLADARTESEALLREAEAIGWPTMVAEAHYWVGFTASDFGERPTARAHLEEAVFIGGGAGDPVAVQAAAALAYMTGNYERDFEGALRWGRLGQMLVEYTDDAGSLREAKLLSDLGYVHSLRDAKPEAIELYREALAIYDERLSPRHPMVAYMLNNLGVAHLELGQVDVALRYHERALALRSHSLPAKHPDLGFTYYGLAQVYERKGEQAQALDYLAAAVDVFAGSYPPHSPYLAQARTDYGRTLAAAGRHADARAQLELALTARLAADSGGGEALASTRFQLAGVLWALGEQARALELGEAARADYSAVALAEGVARVDDWLRERSP